MYNYSNVLLSCILIMVITYLLFYENNKTVHKIAYNKKNNKYKNLIN